MTKVISVANRWSYIYYMYYISATWMRIEESPLLHEIAMAFIKSECFLQVAQIPWFRTGAVFCLAFEIRKTTLSKHVELSFS